MKLEVVTGELKKHKSDAIVLFACEGTSLPHGISKLAKEDGFKGKKNEVNILQPPAGFKCKRILLAGLGKKKDADSYALYGAAGNAAQAAQSDFAKLAFTLPELNAAKVKAPLQQICLGALLALYDFEQYKSKKEDEKKLKHIQLLCSSKQKAQARREVQEAQSIADSVYFTRDIVNQPANHKKPPVLATIIKKEARKTKLKFKMLDERTMKKHGMNALLGVSSGSPVPPRLVILEHGRKRRGKPSLCLVGKGITFDSGGISLKPSKNMDEMKMDMAGAAAVAGAMLAISKLNLPLHVIGIMPLSENMPDGKAQRPGDIVKAMNGKSIEVLNTDAEGRLVLADALAYAEKTYKPDYIVDAATLTGAVLVCLGKHASGLLGNDEQLKRRLIEAGEAVHERCWELPLWDEYKEMVKGKLADVKNIGSESGEAGTITAAAFLSNFLKNRTRWAHLDIAGTAWDDGSKPFKHAGATGVGVRLFIELAKGLS